MNHDNAQLRAIYSDCYKDSSYKMGGQRLQHMLQAVKDFVALRGVRVDGYSILDVGCGRGELLEAVFDQVPSMVKFRGREIVPDLTCPPGIELIESVASMRTDEQFDVVTCADVLEHIVPTDTEEALRRLWACVKPNGTLILNVAWFSHIWRMSDGTAKELHINCRDLTEWMGLVGVLPGIHSWANTSFGNRTGQIVVRKDRVPA